jgi:hypothetical protein
LQVVASRSSRASKLIAACFHPGKQMGLRMPGLLFV